MIVSVSVDCGNVIWHWQHRLIVAQFYAHGNFLCAWHIHKCIRFRIVLSGLAVVGIVLNVRDVPTLLEYDNAIDNAIVSGVAPICMTTHGTHV